MDGVYRRSNNRRTVCIKGYRMNYPSSYKTNLYISKFEKGYGNSKQEGPSYQIDYSVINAFPSVFNPMFVSYGILVSLGYSCI